MSLLTFLHPGDFTLSDWLKFLFALAFWGALLLGIPLAVLLVVVRHYRDNK